MLRLMSDRDSIDSIILRRLSSASPSYAVSSATTLASCSPISRARCVFALISACFFVFLIRIVGDLSAVCRRRLFALFDFRLQAFDLRAQKGNLFAVEFRFPRLFFDIHGFDQQLLMEIVQLCIRAVDLLKYRFIAALSALVFSLPDRAFLRNPADTGVDFFLFHRDVIVFRDICIDFMMLQLLGEIAELARLFRLPFQRRKLLQSDSTLENTNRFSFVRSSFRCVSFLRALNFAIPVASSKMARASSGLADMISSTLPCPMME